MIRIKVTLNSGKTIKGSLEDKEINGVVAILECLQKNFKKDEDSNGYISFGGNFIRIDDISCINIRQK